MKILVLSFFYPPDLGAGSFRTEALVDALQDKLFSDKKDCTIYVLTTIPNRYKSISINAQDFEKNNGVIIKRVRLSSIGIGKLAQFWNFFLYAKFVIFEVKKFEFDIVYATSSRLMTGFLGAVVARKLRVPLYLDIRDLITDVLPEIYKRKFTQRLICKILNRIEIFTFSRANIINVVSPGFIDRVKNVDKNKKISTYTNGIDLYYLNSNIFKKNYDNPIPLVVYAGNIGIGQGLEFIIPESAKNLDGIVRFKIIGDGVCRGELERRLKKLNVTNVELIPPVEREKLIQFYKDADILFLHLNNLTSFLKVIPSKIFEYGAIDKPIVAGVQGCSRDFLLNEIGDVELFNSCDSKGMIKSIKNTLEKKYINNINHAEFRIKFSRKEIMNNMSDDIIQLAKLNKTTKN